MGLKREEIMELMAHEDIVLNLTSERGLTKLRSYSSSIEGHGHLAQYAEASHNTFVRFALQALLQETALVAVRAMPDQLGLPNKLAQDALPTPVRPRPAPLTFQPHAFMGFLEELLVSFKVKRGDVEDLIDQLDPNCAACVFTPSASRTSTYGMLFTVFDCLDDRYNDYNTETGFGKMVRRAAKELITYLLGHEGVHPNFLAELGRRMPGEWDDYVSYGGGTAGVLCTLAQHGLLSPETWAIVQARSSQDLRDLLLLATAHPSLPEREQAISTVQAQIPYFLDKQSFYDLAEASSFLPEKVAAEIVENTARTLVDSWPEPEYRAWALRLSQWDTRASHGKDVAYKLLDAKVRTMVPSAPKKKRWWQA